MLHQQRAIETSKLFARHLLVPPRVYAKQRHQQQAAPTARIPASGSSTSHQPETVIHILAPHAQPGISAQQDPVASQTLSLSMTRRKVAASVLIRSRDHACIWRLPKTT
ncbi:hypothetical protein VTN96DRAFT_1543 [Rasamsonia emersonii]